MLRSAKSLIRCAACLANTRNRSFCRRERATGLIFIIFLLVLVTGGIASFARARGGNPWVWGSACIVSYLFIQFGGGFLAGILGSVATRTCWLLSSLLRGPRLESS